MVGQMAAGSHAAREGAILPFSHAPAFASLFPEASADLSDEWISELVDSLPFKEDLRCKFHRPGHINVLEARMFKTFQKRAARLRPNSHRVGLLDSRVTLGAVAKGRSSSPARCRILQGTLPYTLGGGLYSGNLRVYSSKNRADGPSRNRPVDAPSKEVPVWYQDLCNGEHSRFACVVASSRCSKLAARWLRLLLLLGGDIERNPGPALPRAPRGPLDLTSGFTAGTADRMAECLQGFKTWVSSKLGIPFSRLCLQPEPLVALALRGYGLYLYSAGFPRYLFVCAITARCVSSAPHEVNSCLADRQEMARRRTRRMPSCHFFTYRRSHDCGWLVLVLATFRGNHADWFLVHVASFRVSPLDPS